MAFSLAVPFIHCPIRADLTSTTHTSTMSYCEGCTCGRAAAAQAAPDGRVESGGLAPAEAAQLAENLHTESNGGASVPLRQPRSFTAPENEDDLGLIGERGVAEGRALRSKLWFNCPGDGEFASARAVGSGGSF